MTFFILQVDHDGKMSKRWQLQRSRSTLGYCASLCHQLHRINHWRSLDLCGHRKSCLPRFSIDCHGQQCGTWRTSKDCRRQGSKGFLFLGFRAFGMLSCIVSSIEKGAIGNFVWRLLVHGCIIHWWYSVHRSPIFVVQACETPSKCFLCEKSKLKRFVYNLVSCLFTFIFYFFRSEHGKCMHLLLCNLLDWESYGQWRIHPLLWPSHFSWFWWYHWEWYWNSFSLQRNWKQ